MIEESRLREHITHLKNIVVAVRSTLATDLEPAPVQVDGESAAALTTTLARQDKTADLETAVLVQELMSMREERSDLRARVFRLEREKHALEAALGSQRAQEQALVAHLEQLQRELDQQQVTDPLKKTKKPG